MPTMISKLQLPPWLPDFADSHAIFAPLRHLAVHFSRFADWPTPAELQQFLDQQPLPILSGGGAPLTIVEQAGKPRSMEEYYSVRIYNSGEIQTRRENWHDFFQYLSWFMFPRTKALINAMHYPAVQQRLESGTAPGRRLPIENMLSLLDEGGAVIVADEELMQLIRDFRWKELFWRRREEVAERLRCITFGHAMYEKGLAPYLGMTANCILLRPDNTFFRLNNQQQLKWVDERLYTLLKAGEHYKAPRDLNPFPILGMPGWDADNRFESYYDNLNYFRPGRRGRQENRECSDSLSA